MLLAVIGRGAAVGAATVAFMPVVIRAVRSRIIDEPSGRSSHRVATPRGGGIGPAVAATVVLCAWWAGPRERLFTGLVTACVALGLLGFADDIRRLPALTRLAGQVLVAATAALLLTAGMHDRLLVRAVSVVVAAGWLVAFVNAFNFMDGINGISAVTVVMTGLAWIALGVWQHAGALAVVGAVAAGAGAGFLPFNFPRAAVFLGDVGSYFFGALLGAGAVIGLRAGLHPEAVLAPLVLYVTDTGSTLVRRALRGENVLEAHRDHTYQRICAAGWSHGATTSLVGGLLAASAGLGVVAQGSIGLRVAADVAVAAVVVGYLLVPQLLGRHSQVAAADHT